MNIDKINFDSKSSNTIKNCNLIDIKETTTKTKFSFNSKNDIVKNLGYM